MGRVTLDVPKGKYSQLLITLDSGRVMVIVLPDGLSPQEAAQVVKELDGIETLVAGWKSS